MTTSNPEPNAGIRLQQGYWSRPCRNCPPSGDAAGWLSNDQESWLLVLDAIGHGPVAHGIASFTLNLFKTRLTETNSSPQSISDIFTHLHQALLSRKLDEQAAANLYRFQHLRSSVEMIAIGNLQSSLITPRQAIRLSSQNGMLGGRLPQSLHIQELNLTDNTVLAVLSDGMETSAVWKDLSRYVYGPYANRPLNQTAQLLVDSFHHDHDDASCALVRISAQHP